MRAGLSLLRNKVESINGEHQCSPKHAWPPISPTEGYASLVGYVTNYAN